MNKRVVARPGFKLISALFLLVLAIMPVHTFFSTWIGSELGNTDAVKAVKDVIVFVAGLLLAWELKNDKKLFRKLADSWVNKAIVAFACLHVLAYIFLRPEFDAALVGTAFNTRYLLFFIVAQALSFKLGVSFRDKALKFILVMGGVVSVFGFLQVTLLDTDVLTNFGYGADTVRPYLTIDNNPDYVRINSTLRGPNELGAYLMVVAFAAIIAWAKHSSLSSGWRRWIILGSPFWLVSFWNAQSRSAAVGLIAGLAVFGILQALMNPKYRNYLVGALAGVAIMLPVGYMLAKDTSFYQIVVLHDDKSDNKAESSNTNRLRAYTRAFSDLSEHPFGRGPGTSGPASTYNSDITRLSENYYLQIGQELGYIGMAAIISIIGFAAIKLWRIKSLQANALLGALAGFAMINLFLHGWTDDTSSLIFWGILGVYINDSRHK